MWVIYLSQIQCAVVASLRKSQCLKIGMHLPLQQSNGRSLFLPKDDNYKVRDPNNGIVGLPYVRGWYDALSSGVLSQIFLICGRTTASKLEQVSLIMTCIKMGSFSFKSIFPLCCRARINCQTIICVVTNEGGTR